MPASHTERHAANLRWLAERLGHAPLKELTRQPTISALYRVTISYHDHRALDAVATLRYQRGQPPTLSISYEGAFQRRPLSYTLPPDRYRDWTLALQRLRFDRMPDQTGLPLYGLDIWMLERAAGGFVHSVILSPQTADGPHADLVEAVHAHLPEVLREVQP